MCSDELIKHYHKLLVIILQFLIKGLRPPEKVTLVSSSYKLDLGARFPQFFFLGHFRSNSEVQIFDK